MKDAREPHDLPVTESNGFEALPLVLTSKEAANVLRVGVREIRQLVDSGQLPAARLGPRRVVRIRKESLLVLLSGHLPKGVRRAA